MTDRYAGYKRLKLDRPAPRILQITLDTPGKLNAADDAMHGELSRIWRDIDEDPDVSVAMIRGAGNAFSAGGDFDMLDKTIGNAEMIAVGIVLRIVMVVPLSLDFFV